MNDLMLTKNGDIAFFSEVRKKESFCLKFIISDTKACKINFIISDSKPIQKSDTAIKLKFNIESKKKSFYPVTIDKTAAAQQACLIRIKTEVGELLYRKTIGSQISKVRHDFLFDEITISQVKAFTEEAIADIYPNADVTVEPVAKIYGDGYRQSMLLKIYDDDIMILEYEVR